MTTFKNTVNQFGNSPGDSLSECATEWKGPPNAWPKGKLKRYPGAVGNISGGNRRLAKASYGAGDNGTSFRGTNAFTRGGKGK